MRHMHMHMYVRTCTKPLLKLPLWHRTLSPHNACNALPPQADTYVSTYVHTCGQGSVCKSSRAPMNTYVPTYVLRTHVRSTTGIFSPAKRQASVVEPRWLLIVADPTHWGRAAEAQRPQATKAEDVGQHDPHALGGIGHADLQWLLTLSEGAPGTLLTS